MTTTSFRVWLDAARPRTLPAALTPVLMGAALAAGAGAFHAPAALAALLGALLIQISANYANDYYDFVKGADTQERQGPTRATQAGLVSPQSMKRAMLLTLALAAAPGMYLIHRGGWPILAVGLLAMLFAVLYTGGPLPLGYIGAADVFVLVFFGPIAVAGTYYVQAQSLTATPIVAGLAPGLLSTAILTVNNLRDVEQDRAANKKTLAVRFGIAFARWEYLVAATTAIMVIPVVVCLTEGGGWGALASMAMMLPAAKCVRTVLTERDGATLNACLAATGKVLLGYGLLFSLGWLLSV